MKKILLTQRLIENENYCEIREALDIRLADMFISLGFLPIALPYKSDFRSYFELGDVAGVVLTGGNDLTSTVDTKINRLRDNFEKDVTDYSINKDIKIFGFCRGLQFLCEYFGGSLKQVDNHVATLHKITASSDSRYSQFIDKIGSVNSYHNYGVDTMPSEFIVSATSDDGVIEAIEHSSKKIFAQMWHSEREEPFVDSQKSLIKHFLDS